jgi:hypothetical protein
MPMAGPFSTARLRIMGCVARSPPDGRLPLEAEDVLKGFRTLVQRRQALKAG